MIPPRILLAALLAGLLAGCGGDPAPDPQGQEEAKAAAEDAGDTTAPEASASELAQEEGRELRRRLLDSTAGQNDWIPDLVAPVDGGLPELLRRAAEARAEGRLEEGEGNALSLYLAARQQAPDDAGVRAGLAAVVADLVARGEALLAEGRLAEAMRIGRALARAAPDEPRVQALSERIEAARGTALLLEEAERRIEAGQWLPPEEPSALGIYREILREDPANPPAREGLERLERRLIEQAEAAAEAGAFSRAERLLADAAQVRPGSQAVQNAMARLVEQRNLRTAPLVAEAQQAIAEGRLDAAAGLIEQIEAISTQAEGIDELRQRLENARIYASLQPGQGFRDPLASGGRGPEMLVLPVGAYTMGSPNAEPDRRSNEGPAHRVTLRRAIAMARFETTVGEFRRFVAATGYVPTATQRGRSVIYDERAGQMRERRGVSWEHDHAGRPADEAMPVVHVSWLDARAFAAWLARETGRAYRLPSEAEFEYALRAGTTTPYWWGEGPPDRPLENLTGEQDRSASGRRWVNAFAGYGDGFWGAAPAGRFVANPFGLHDMGGNVSEWVEDCWHENYLRAPVDGSAWVNEGCNRRVIRGASWASSPDQARSAFRLPATADTTNARVGFRVVRDL